MKLQNSEPFLPFVKTTIHQGNFLFTWKVGQWDGWRLAIYNFVGSSLYRSMKGGVVPPFSQGKPMNPMVRFIWAHTPKISFQAPINDLGLPICLWVISGGKLQLNPLKTHEFLPELTYENCVPVTCNHVRKSMQPKDMINERLSHCRSCIRVS